MWLNWPLAVWLRCVQPEIGINSVFSFGWCWGDLSKFHLLFPFLAMISTPLMDTFFHPLGDGDNRSWILCSESLVIRIFMKRRCNVLSYYFQFRYWIQMWYWVRFFQRDGIGLEGNYCICIMYNCNTRRCGHPVTVLSFLCCHSDFGGIWVFNLTQPRYRTQTKSHRVRWRLFSGWRGGRYRCGRGRTTHMFWRISIPWFTWLCF